MSAPSHRHLPAFAYAHAKINLTLDVLGKREDGYHALASIMQTVSQSDTLLLHATSDGKLDFTCDVAELQSQSNLALRAAELLRREANRPELGARIELHKEIPVQAGLGGGSSDAGCVLVEMNRLWQLAIPPSRLRELAAELGSDVPFFVHEVYGGAGSTAEIAGRGEYVTGLPPAEPLWLVLAKPEIGVSTARVFGHLPASEYSDGTNTALVAEAIRKLRPIPFEHLFNALEPGVFRQYPEIARLRDQLRETGAPVVRMSGSGPSLFAPFRTLAEASVVYQQMRSVHPLVWLVHTI